VQEIKSHYKPGEYTKKGFIMVDQAQVDSNDNPSALNDDPIFSAVHDAFQLGWSIIELKSRIQIAALSTTITGSPQVASAIASINSSQNQANQTLPQVFSKVMDAKKQLLLPEYQQNPVALPDNAWLTSLWRATFNRIAESHKSCFPKGSTTEGTLYNLPDPHPPVPSQQGNNPAPDPTQQVIDPSQTYPPYLYLYPTNDQDYAGVGIKQDDRLSGFRIYDVARRAINCLTLLYTNSAYILTPIKVVDFQNQLIENVRNNFSKLDQNNTEQSERLKADLDANSLDQRKVGAIKILSTNAIRLLETWDTYARETLYVSGGADQQTDEIQLVAYEAGRAMASLSWGISTKIVPIENALNHQMNSASTTSQEADTGQETGDSTQPQPQPVNDGKELEQHLALAWLNMFDDRSIASIQQQISALSTALDNAYYRTHPGLPHPNPNDPEERTNLALPSQSIQAVTFSLEYWKRSIQRICNEQPPTKSENSTPETAKLPEANQKNPIPEQATKPGANQKNPTSSGVQKILAVPGMNKDTSKALRLALVQQAEIWQPLLLHQQSLLDFTTQYVTQHILNDFMNECEQATSQEIQNEIKKFRVPLIIGGGVILLLLVTIILLFITFPSSSQTLASGFALVIGGIVGFFGTVAARLSSIFSPSPSSAVTTQGSAGPLTAIPGLAGAALVEAFQSGYNQILVEFDYLNHNISITYPLVEFFILQSVLTAKQINENISEVETVVVETIKDAYDFLTQIAWTNQDRADEIARVARAAFGPIGAFVGAQLSLLSNQNNKSPTIKK
jgi:hypothetical protein